MNQDSQKSAQPCGCDEGAQYRCAEYPDCAESRAFAAGRILVSPTMGEILVEPTPEWAKFEPIPDEPPVGSTLFGDDAAGRKGYPVFTGVLMYFPDALAAVAAVSKKGNDQHNPGQPLHWAREKSTDQMDTTTRHLMDHGSGKVRDADGGYHLAKAAWRILAELQLTIEAERR